MYHDDKWNAVEGEELQGFLDQINPIDNKFEVGVKTTQVHWRMLPFYESVALIRVKEPAWPNEDLFIYYLTDAGNLFRLNGTSPPIHEVNAKAPIKVTEENVLDYLRFFCFFVRGEEGPFYVAESIDDPNMPNDMDDATRQAVEDTVREAEYHGKNDQGHFLCDAVVFYSNALFIANFAVQPSGMIEMLDDEPQRADLNTRIKSKLSDNT